MIPRTHAAGRSAAGLLSAGRLFVITADWASRLGSVWYFALMLLVAADVAARELFSAPIRGVFEITAYSIIGGTFLQLAASQVHQRMIRADFLLQAIEVSRPTTASALETAASVVGAAIMAIAAVHSWPLLARAYREAEAVGVPGEFSFLIWPFRLVVMFCCALTCLAFCATALRRMGAILRSQYALPGCAAAALLLVVPGLAIFALDAADLSHSAIGLAMVAFLLALVYVGVHIGISLILTGFIGLWLLKGNWALAFKMVAGAVNDHLANYFLAAVPLFVLMGLLVSISDIGREIFVVAHRVMGRIRGGLAIATVAANAVFAATVGSSVASAAVFTRLAAPEMIRHRFSRRFALGVVAGSSVLGMLIPPSLLFIVYGFLTEQSVGHLFIAAVVPGLLLAVLFCATILVMATFVPERVYAAESRAEADHAEAISLQRAALYLAPVVALVATVLGGLYGGLFTPTEGGAVGSLCALLYALWRGKLRNGALSSVVMQAGHVATSVLFLILGASVFTRMLAASGLVQELSRYVIGLNLGFVGFSLIYVALLVVLGMFLESISIMLIVVPLSLPVAVALGGDPIWFGVLTVVAVEIGLLTPPFGLSVYVVKSVLDDASVTLSEIFSGTLPFVFAMLVLVLIIIAAPSITRVFL